MCMELAEMRLNSHILVETSIGNFVIELKVKDAPKTCAYFIQLLADETLTKGTLFRVLTDENQKSIPKINVIQLGSDSALEESRTIIEHENTSMTSLVHKKWSVSAARYKLGEVYQSFFICMRDEPELNFAGARHPDGLGFACFGKVSKGFDVVEKLYKVAGHKEILEPPIIIGAYRLIN